MLEAITNCGNSEKLWELWNQKSVFTRIVPIFRSSRSEVFLRKDVLKICSKFTEEHPCQSAISIKLQRNCIETPLRHQCSPVNLLHIFRTSFPKNTPGRLLLDITLNVLIIINSINVNSNSKVL